MKCESCGAKLADGVLFCRECGAKVINNSKIKRFCRECGASLAEGVKFCSECGAKVDFKENAQKQESFSDSKSITEPKNKVKENRETIIDVYSESINGEDIQNGEKKFSQKEKQSFSDKAIDKAVIFWNGLDTFCKVVTVSLGFIILILLIGILSPNGLSVFISIVQIAGIIASVLIHKDIIKVSKGWLKYAILGVAILLIIVNIKSYSMENRKTSANTDSPSISENQQTNEEEGIYTYQIRNYVGRNLASIGTKWGDYRVDEYGYGKLKLIYESLDGVLVSASDEEQLKKYVVLGQNIPENKVITIVHLRDSKGKPYSNLVDYQSYEEIVLYVGLVGENEAFNKIITEIKPSPNRRTCYVRDYVGRNAASFGKTFGSNREDEYFWGKIKFIFSSTDGSYVDVNDINALKQYVVIGQDVAANEEIQLVYETDSKGNEYDNLIKSQNIETISLAVEKLDDAIIATMPEIETESYDQNDYTDVTVEYKVLSNGKAEITGYTGEGNHVTIDSKIDGHEVVSIGNRAFENCDSLEGILCWADIEEIGEYAFVNCSSLKEISVPSSTKKIGAHAFEGCAALAEALLWGDPEIEEYAFARCTSLKEISISSKTEKVGAHAFEGCSSLVDVLLWGDPDIGEYAFANCTSIEELSIGSKTKRIGEHAFDGCTALSEVLIWGDDTVIGKAAFANCPNLKNRPVQIEEDKSTTTPEKSKDTKETTSTKEEPKITEAVSEEKKPVTEEKKPAVKEKKSESVSYSTNTKDTVKNGNSGVYAYKKGGSYDIYYIIDFDNGYVYWFTDGNGDSSCDRLKIESGDLNSVLIVTYHDGGDVWSNGLHFKYKNQPDHLIMEDNDHFEYDFRTTSLSTALRIRDTKTMHDY